MKDIKLRGIQFINTVTEFLNPNSSQETSYLSSGKQPKVLDGKQQLFSIILHLDWHGNCRTVDKRRTQIFGEKIGINAIKYGSAGGNVMLNAVRTSGNMVEQSPAFLILLWLHGIFISPSSASWHGWLWLFFRSIYPQVFGTIPYIFFSTFPGYFIIASLTWPLARLTYKTDSD